MDRNYISQDIVNRFERHAHSFRGTTLRYRLFIPETLTAGKAYPLLLVLHGSGERGWDNESQIRHHRIATVWAEEKNQKKHPCFVVAPQCPLRGQWVDASWAGGSYRISRTPVSKELACASNLVTRLMNKFPLDDNRIYVTGISMGGFGVWDLIMRYPGRFAAGVPMSGGADTSRAASIAHIPVWNFHGETDEAVPVSGSREMIEALERAGVTCLFTHADFHNGERKTMPYRTLGTKIKQGAALLYTEYPGKGHVIWEESYGNPRLIEWLFMQKRKRSASKPPKPKES
jgi:predicted peptidase